MTLDDAVETLATTYADPVLIARGLPVDAKEVADALANATPDTTEFVVLTLLAQVNPYIAPVVAIQEVSQDTTE
jgi:hypothetical protein